MWPLLNMSKIEIEGLSLSENKTCMYKALKYVCGHASLSEMNTLFQRNELSNFSCEKYLIKFIYWFIIFLKTAHPVGLRNVSATGPCFRLTAVRSILIFSNSEQKADNWQHSFYVVFLSSDSIPEAFKNTNLFK